MSETRPTLHIPSLTGVWREVFDVRERLHRDADKAVLIAWADCVADADVDAAARAAVQSLVGRTFESDVPGEPGTPAGRRRRLDVLALTLAAILHRMARSDAWDALRAVLARYLTVAWQAGWDASRAVSTPDSEETPPEAPVMTSTADGALQTGSRWTIAGAAKAAAAVLVAAATSGGAVKRIGRALRAFLRDPLGLRLAVDQALSAAYADGMRAQQQTAGVRQVAWVTAGDNVVCKACAAYETDGPYPIDQAPSPPEHPSCRCVLVPTT